MTRNIISIDDRGYVSVPNGKIMMRDYEIAHLLEIMYPTVRGAIKRLLKSRAWVDSQGAVVQGRSIIPEYYGLEVVIAIAFQVDGYEQLFSENGLWGKYPRQPFNLYLFR